jgi:ABC-type transport system involved in Fe-S cluster assembly fused permease/ATPase subunit
MYLFSMLLQLSVPFNYIGYTYQEIRQAYVDMKYITNVIVNVQSSILVNKTDEQQMPSLDDVYIPAAILFLFLMIKHLSAIQLFICRLSLGRRRRHLSSEMSPVAMASQKESLC